MEAFWDGWFGVGGFASKGQQATLESITSGFPGHPTLLPRPDSTAPLTCRPRLPEASEGAAPGCCARLVAPPVWRGGSTPVTLAPRQLLATDRLQPLLRFSARLGISGYQLQHLPVGFPRLLYTAGLFPCKP